MEDFQAICPKLSRSSLHSYSESSQSTIPASSLWEGKRWCLEPQEIYSQASRFAFPLPYKKPRFSPKKTLGLLIQEDQQLD
jgi:hypothetical protein